jgi:hypothetical protein
MHASTPVPTRITIDFRDDVQPTHSWIVGATPGSPRRIQLLAMPAREVESRRDVEPRPAWTASPAVEPFAGEPAVVPGECCCPEFCELDHANE